MIIPPTLFSVSLLFISPEDYSRCFRNLKGKKGQVVLFSLLPLGRIPLESYLLHSSPPLICRGYVEPQRMPVTVGNTQPYITYYIFPIHTCL